MAESAAANDTKAAEGAENKEEKVPVNEMKSVVLTGFGGLKMVKTQKKAEPVVKDGEVLIRVKACGVNFLDLMVRQGVVDNAPKTPVTLGFECAGEIQALGEGVVGLAIGDRVLGLVEYNAWAELVTVPSKFVYKMPINMSYEDGAALPMNYLTAYILLFELANIRSGQSILIHSAAGGVGHALCQLSKLVDGVTVYGTSSQPKHEAIKDNLNNVFDRSTTDYAQEIRKLAPEGIDVVLDCLCGDDTNKGISLLKPMGKYILYGSSNIVTGETKSFFSFAKSWWQVDKISPIKLFDENKSVSGFHLRQLLYRQGCHDYIRTLMDKLFQLYGQGKIRPVIDSTWAFEDTVEAMQKLHDRKNVGKLLLDPKMEPKVKEPDDDDTINVNVTLITLQSKDPADGAAAQNAAAGAAADKGETESAAEQ